MRPLTPMPQALEQGPLDTFGLGPSSLDSPYLLPDDSLSILILSLRGEAVARLIRGRRPGGRAVYTTVNPPSKP